LFFYLISAVGGERQQGGCSRIDGRTRRGEKERDNGGKRFLALRWQTITGLPHKLDCRWVQMYVAINLLRENNGDSFCKWRKT